ncbi:MAG: S8 family serine peptidase, partial [Acetatifactor sp.]|nr:S8 family serine peptidase [Acetatifactor sp.]
MQRVREQLRVPFRKETDGSGITVGVLDTGIGQHPDLADRLIRFQDFVGRRALMYDDNGHGTHVCGILCGSGAASQGKYMGMAPGVRLVVGKVLDEKGDGSTESMLMGLDWILRIREQCRIRILNISVGIGTLEEAEKEQRLRAMIEAIWDCGILVV